MSGLHETRSAQHARVKSEAAGKCWHWSHRYPKWEDGDETQQRSAITHRVIRYGIEQKRHCEKCGKLQLRIAWY